MKTEEKVKKILDELGEIDLSQVTRGKDGTLDVKEFNMLPKVREAVNKIKELGWDRKTLMDNFFNAGMILIFDMPKEVKK